MKYEIVELKEKTVVGLTARTNNNAPDMGQVIGELWQNFYKLSVYEGIKGKKSEKALGIYSDYAGNEMDDYNVTVACEADPEAGRPENTVIKTIPAGKYAKFIVTGDMYKAVAEFWQELWKTELDRTFVCDFEEYQNSDMENAIVHVYIGVKK